MENNYKEKIQDQQFDFAFYIILFLYCFLFIFKFFEETVFEIAGGDGCFGVLGCDNGFFGYDGVVHFFGGLVEAVGIVWIIHKYPRFNIFKKTFFRSALIVVSIVSLITILWESQEFIADFFEDSIVHKLVYLGDPAQSGLSDTMGDIMLGFLGSLGGVAIIRYIDKNIFSRIYAREQEALTKESL